MSDLFERGRRLAEELGIFVRDYGDHKSSTGRSVYLQGQLHSNESAAMLVLWDLIRKLDQEQPTNLIRVVPNANPIGWSRYLNSGQGRISADGVNWNRMFSDPLKEPRTVDAQLTRALWQLSCGFDVVIDVHTPEFGWPHLYASSVDHRLTTMDDIPHVLYGPPTSGPFDESHFLMRTEAGLSPAVASVTMELPSHEIPTDSYVDEWSQRLFSELGSQAKSEESRGDPQFAGTMLDVVPAVSGAVILKCKPGGVLEKDAPLMKIQGRTGESEILNAPGRCIPVCFRRATVIQSGYWACRVIAL